MTVAVLATLALLSRPALCQAQTIEPLPIDQGRPAFADAPAAGDGAQLDSLIALTEEARRAVGSLTDLFRQGEFQRVAAEALQWQNDAAKGDARRIRVGMFFEDVTFNMLRLFSGSQLRQCPRDLLPVVDSELKQLETAGRGNGAVFGRSAFEDVSRRC